MPTVLPDEMSVFPPEDPHGAKAVFDESGCGWKAAFDLLFPDAELGEVEVDDKIDGWIVALPDLLPAGCLNPTGSPLSVRDPLLDRVILGAAGAVAVLVTSPSFRIKCFHRLKHFCPSIYAEFEIWPGVSNKTNIRRLPKSPKLTGCLTITKKLKAALGVKWQANRSDSVEHRCRRLPFSEVRFQGPFLVRGEPIHLAHVRVVGV